MAFALTLGYPLVGEVLSAPGVSSSLFAIRRRTNSFVLPLLYSDNRAGSVRVKPSFVSSWRSLWNPIPFNGALTRLFYIKGVR